MKKTLIIIGLCIILMFSLVSGYDNSIPEADSLSSSVWDNVSKSYDENLATASYYHYNEGSTIQSWVFVLGESYPPLYFQDIGIKSKSYCQYSNGKNIDFYYKNIENSWVNLKHCYNSNSGTQIYLECNEYNMGNLTNKGLKIVYTDTCAYDQKWWGYEIIYDVANFSILAKNIENSWVNNFSININGVNYNTTMGSIITGINTSDTSNLYNVTISSEGYDNISLIDLNISENHVYTFILQEVNSVDFYIKNEDSGDNITNQVNITMSNLDNEYINQTSTGHIYLKDLNAGVYTVKFESQDYTTKFYGLTISNTSHSELTAYLGNYTDEVIFTVKSQDSGIIIDGAMVNFNKRIDGEWATVGSKFTDITGKAQFYYDNSAEYNIVISKDGYETKNTILNPILYDNYNVNLETETGFAETIISSDVFFSFTPTTFVNGNNSFSFTISSPSGSLTNYVLNVSYPDSYINRSGNNAIGGSFEFNFTTDAELFDKVTVDVIYNTSLGENTHKTYSYYIPVNETEGTWLGMGTYGMGLFERFLIATLFVLFLAGFTFVLVGSDAGLVIGGLIYGFFVIVGFIPLWGIIPTLFAIMILLMRGGSS